MSTALGIGCISNKKISQYFYCRVSFPDNTRVSLKGQCHEIFDNFFLLKIFFLGKKGKTDSRKISFSRRYVFHHKVRKSRVRVVNDY